MSDKKSVSGTAWVPLKRPFFRLLWISNSFSQIGGWMHEVGAAWLMTSLAPTPFMVAMIQTAAALPMALLALPAGALADIFDRKRLLLSTYVWRIIVTAGLGLIAVLGYATPWVLLAATFALGIGMALGAPAWQAIIPDIVSREEVPEAVTLNAVSFNATRGVGPALGGVVVAAAGSGGTFFINSVSILWVSLVLKSWKHKIQRGTLPEEQLIGAIRTGMRFVANSPEVKSLLIHTAVFSLFSSAMWSLLPIVSRIQMGLSSVGYGILIGIFGAGGLAGVIVLSKIRRKVVLNLLIVISTILFSSVLFAMAYGKSQTLLAISMFCAGASWVVVTSMLMAALQSVIPNWVVGRVMSVHALIFFGTQAGGSALWGFTGDFFGMPFALGGAGILLIVSLLFTRRYKLITGENLDLRPDREWTLAPLHTRPGMEEGPVLVSIEYRIDPDKAGAFIKAMGPMKATRRKYGAIRWLLFRDVADPAHYRESFVVESWAGHLRQHERFTVSDTATLLNVNSFAEGGRPYKIEHFIVEPVAKAKAR